MARDGICRLVFAFSMLMVGVAAAQIPDDPLQPGQHPPSQGFAAPGDISKLLAYRLPTWWARTWDLDFDLDGRAASISPGDDDDRTESALRTMLASEFVLEVDGERRQGWLDAAVSGDYAATDIETGTIDQSQHSGDVNARAYGQLREYFAEKWSLLAGASGQWNYREVVQERKDQDDSIREARYTRGYRASLRLGAGLGRLRNVTPLVRAGRLDERLAALGHERLDPDGVLAVAEGLARQPAYQRVFSRPDRRFWDDVLAPVNARTPLGPFETFYLTEVLQENLGLRREGWQIDLFGEVAYNHSIGPASDTGEIWDLRPVLNVGWSHNLSLARQLAVNAMAAYQWRQRHPQDSEIGQIFLDVEYLWTLADRVLWQNRLETFWIYRERAQPDVTLSIDRQFQTTLTSSLSVFLEDRLSLTPAIALDFREATSDDVTDVQRLLTYSLRFSYALDRTLW